MQTATYNYKNSVGNKFWMIYTQRWLILREKIRLNTSKEKEIVLGEK